MKRIDDGGFTLVMYNSHEKEHFQFKGDENKQSLKAIIKVNRRLFNKSKFSIPTYIRKVAFVTYTCKKAFSNLWFWTGNKTTLKNSFKSRTIFEFFSSFLRNLLYSLRLIVTLMNRWE